MRETERETERERDKETETHRKALMVLSPCSVSENSTNTAHTATPVRSYAICYKCYMPYRG